MKTTRPFDLAGLVTAAAIACTFVAAPAAAHHGIANFDLNSDIEISGTVAEISFINPHSWLYLDVVGEDGETTRWGCELRGGTVLRRSGWSPEMFETGTELTVSGSPDRFRANTCYLGTAMFADGTRIDRYGQIEAPPAARAERQARLENGHPNISGDWAAEQRVLTDPRGISGAFLPLSVATELEPGAVPAGTRAFPGARGTEVSLADDPIGAYWDQASALPLTDAGREAIEGFDGASSDNPRLRCEVTNILFDWTFEMDVNRITQREDSVSLRYGSMGLERVIHMNMEEHPDEIEPSRSGHSIGQWQDDVLVVDTIGFEAGILLADGRVPHSDRLHVVERFSLDPEALALTRRYTAVDPLYFEGEYRGADTIYLSDLPYQGAPCDDRGFRSDLVEPTPAPATAGGGGSMGIGIAFVTLAGVALLAVVAVLRLKR